MHMSESPIMDPIILQCGKKIEPVKEKEGYTFLGFKLSYSNDIGKLIENNLNSKRFNVIKFNAWLEYNEDTPFFVIVKVLYACLFASLLYSVEAWGEMNKFKEKVMKIE